MEKEIKEISEFNKVVDTLTILFIAKYFDIKTADYYWIADDKSGVLSINDYFFSLTRIYEAIKYNASSKKLFEYYDEELNCSMKNKPMDMNFVNYVKYKKELIK